MQEHRHRQISAAMLVRIVVLLEEKNRDITELLKLERKRDQALLWNNTFAHCHHDG